MEAEEKKKESPGTSPELLAIASKAIEQALARHQISQVQLEKLVNEPQSIFEFFEDLLAREESDPTPPFRLDPEKQFFVIEALSGVCLKVDHAKLVSKRYHPRNFAIEAAACFSGDSPASQEIKARVYHFKGEANITEAFTSIEASLKKLLFTRAQIRHFCSKYADIILLKNMVPIFLFDRCELMGDCAEGIMAATAHLNSINFHMGIGTLDRKIRTTQENDFYLVAPVKQYSEDESPMLEYMELWEEM